MRLQHAGATALGLTAALGGEPLERAWFDAWADHEADADEMAYRVNADRLTAAVRARLGR